MVTTKPWFCYTNNSLTMIFVEKQTNFVREDSRLAGELLESPPERNQRNQCTLSTEHKQR